MSDDRAGRFIAGGVVGLVGCLVLVGNFAYDAGFTAGRDAALRDGSDKYETVMSQMRDIGLCRWPAAFYAAAKCQGTMTYIETMRHAQ